MYICDDLLQYVWWLDKRLFTLGQAVRAAQDYIFTNGLSKALSWRLLNIVTTLDYVTEFKNSSSFTH